jgi:hypothetical protein
VPLRAKVAKTSGQNITRGAYKVAHKLGSKGAPTGDTGLKKRKPKQAKLAKASGKRGRLDTVPGEIIDELTKLGMGR